MVKKQLPPPSLRKGMLVEYNDFSGVIIGDNLDPGGMVGIFKVLLLIPCSRTDGIKGPSVALVPANIEQEKLKLCIQREPMNSMEMNAYLASFNLELDDEAVAVYV